MRFLFAMRCVAALILLIWAGLTLRGTAPESMNTIQETEAKDSRIPVVVELFTAEGCSSCPPADELLAELENRQPFRNVEIIGLEEHVDYWDQQGWVDPFSSGSWTSRQSVYSGVLGNGNPYTPEMVIDGREGFVGSHTAQARQAIATAAARKKSTVKLSEVSAPENKAVILDISVENVPASEGKDTPEVLLAITETGLHSKVTAGENSGKELRHASVLRDLKAIGVAERKDGEGFAARRTVKLNSNWKVENLRAVVFVQEKKSRHIVGAAEMHLAAQLQ